MIFIISMKKITELTYNEWMNEQRDNYLMDIENEILHKYGSDFLSLMGERRNNTTWINLIKRFMDTGVYETQEEQDKFIEYYKMWVRNGGGDEWWFKQTGGNKVCWFNVRFSRFEQHFLTDIPKNVFFVFDENECLRGIGTVDGTDITWYADKVEELKRKMDEEVSKMIEKYNELREKESS